MKGGLESLSGGKKKMPADIAAAMRKIDWEHVEEEGKEPALIQYLEEQVGHEIPEELWDAITEASGKKNKAPGLSGLTISVTVPGDLEAGE